MKIPKNVAVRLRSLRFDPATLWSFCYYCRIGQRLRFPLRSLRFSKSPGFPNGCGSVAERAVHPHTPIRLLGVLVGTPRLRKTSPFPSLARS